MDEKVVVVGNGVSGFACAARLAERGVAVTMIGPGLPHDRPPLSKRALTDRPRADPGRRRETRRSAASSTSTASSPSATSIAAASSSTRPPAARRSRSTRRTLVWATGLRYPKPPVPGFENAEENATAAGLESLVRRIAVPGRRVVVVGAGLIGTETAATLAAAHDVTLLDMVDRPLARFLPRVSEAAQGRTRRARRALPAAPARSSRVELEGTGAVVHTSTHGDIACDVVVSAAGFRTSLPPELAGADATRAHATCATSSCA